jgi:hypothetical protein
MEIFRGMRKSFAKGEFLVAVLRLSATTDEAASTIIKISLWIEEVQE